MHCSTNDSDVGTHSHMKRNNNNLSLLKQEWRNPLSDPPSSIHFFISGPLRDIVLEEWLLLCLGNSHVLAEIERFDILVKLKSLFFYFVSWNHV